MTTNNAYLTSDTWLAAFLVLSNIELLHIERDPKITSRARYIFDDSPKCEELALLYRSYQAPIDALKYRQTIEALRNRIKQVLGATPTTKTK